MKKIILFLGLAILTTVSFADNTKLVGKITDLRTYQHNWDNPNSTSDYGYLFIYMDDLPPACDNTSNSFKRVAIKTNNPMYQTVLSMALTAKSTGADIEMYYLDTCSFISGGWDIGVMHLR